MMHYSLPASMFCISPLRPHKNPNNPHISYSITLFSCIFPHIAQLFSIKVKKKSEKVLAVMKKALNLQQESTKL